MAWTAPITFVDGDPLTAAQLNLYLNETAVADLAADFKPERGKD